MGYARYATRPLTPHGPPHAAILVTFQCRSLAPSHPVYLLLVLGEGASSSIHNHSNSRPAIPLGFHLEFCDLCYISPFLTV
jgi:hypothetical protein